MNSRTVAIVVLHTEDHKILLQKRVSITKWGEEWSFWGGGIEPGETKEDAARRELEEELDFKIDGLTYLGKKTKILKSYPPPHEEKELTYEIFVSEVDEDLSLFTVKEGDEAKFFTISEARGLKMVPELDAETLDLVEAHFTSKHS